MRKNIFIIAAGLLVAVAMLAAAFGCSTPATPTASPSGTASPTVPTTQSPTAKPTTTASVPPTQASVIKWKMQSAYQFGSAFPTNFAIAWADWVKHMTNGRMEIEVHPPGTFASGTDLINALSKGTVDATLDFAGYYPEKIPISQVETGLPLAWQDSFQVYDAYWKRGLYDLVKAEYDKLNILALAVAYDGSTWYHFGTNFPFNSLEDIKGKKIRATGIYGKYTAALGGQPTVVNSSEMYMALKTGIISGYIMGISTLDTYKLNEVTTHYVVEPTLSPLVTTAPWINKDSWNKLPADIKQILGDTRYFYAESSMGYKLSAYNTLVTAESKHGTKFVKLSEEDQQKAREVAMKLWDDVAKLTPETAKAVGIVMQQLRDYNKIK